MFELVVSSKNPSVSSLMPPSVAALASLTSELSLQQQQQQPAQQQGQQGGGAAYDGGGAQQLPASYLPRGGSSGHTDLS